MPGMPKNNKRAFHLTFSTSAWVSLLKSFTLCVISHLSHPLKPFFIGCTNVLPFPVQLSQMEQRPFLCAHQSVSVMVPVFVSTTHQLREMRFLLLSCRGQPRHANPQCANVFARSPFSLRINLPNLLSRVLYFLQNSHPLVCVSEREMYKCEHRT